MDDVWRYDVVVARLTLPSAARPTAGGEEFAPPAEPGLSGGRASLKIIGLAAGNASE
jgi:hypothetical protein